MPQLRADHVGRREMAPDTRAPGDAALVVVKRQPFNAETPLVALRELYTPTALFYVRSNFAAPAVGSDWRLIVDGAVEHELILTMDELRALPNRVLSTTMECAGNDRTGFAPPADGEPWGAGAVSSARWRGVALRSVLERAGVRETALEILFEGADGGSREGVPHPIPFARSLPMPQALHPDTLLVYEMNGEPLSQAHGGPLRLIVPGWYGMASVKWLARIAAIEQTFTGHFQADRYIMQRPGEETRTPLREMCVKALITNPAPGATMAPGLQTISGAAWSGQAPIATVELSVDSGDWQPARLLGEPQPYFWRQWEFDWQATPGAHTIAARARDEAGAEQPEEADWNRLGYVNNAVERMKVEVIRNA